MIFGFKQERWIRAGGIVEEVEKRVSEGMGRGLWQFSKWLPREMAK